MYLFDLRRRWIAPERPAPAINSPGGLPQTGVNPLAGKPLRYLIGATDPGPGQDGEIIEAGYDVTAPPSRGIGIAYCNLFD